MKKGACRKSKSHSRIIFCGSRASPRPELCVLQHLGSECQQGRIVHIDSRSDVV